MLSSVTVPKENLWSAFFVIDNISLAFGFIRTSILIGRLYPHKAISGDNLLDS